MRRQRGITRDMRAVLVDLYLDRTDDVVSKDALQLIALTCSPSSVSWR